MRWQGPRGRGSERFQRKFSNRKWKKKFIFSLSYFFNGIFRAPFCCFDRKVFDEERRRGSNRKVLLLFCCFHFGKCCKLDKFSRIFHSIFIDFDSQIVRFNLPSILCHIVRHHTEMLLKNSCLWKVFIFFFYICSKAKENEMSANVQLFHETWVRLVESN